VVAAGFFAGTFTAAGIALPLIAAYVSRLFWGGALKALEKQCRGWLPKHRPKCWKLLDSNYFPWERQRAECRFCDPTR
jgi:hypothetical protein